MPVATTENVAVAGAVTIWFAGWVVIVGTTGVAAMLSVAALLGTLPAALLTDTVNDAPVSAVVVAAVV